MYTNKTILITGGTDGIGRSLVLQYLDLGANVVTCGRDQQKILALEAEAPIGKLCVLNADVSSERDCERSVSHAVKLFGGIDVLINNAGIAHIGNVLNTSEEDFQKIFQVNVKGAFNCMQAVIPFMEEMGQGLIINMASIAATIGIRDRFAYSMSKGAILSMTLSVAKDFIKKGIRCNCISPARVHTPFVDGFLDKHYPGKQQEMFEKLSASQPIGRMAEPEEVAQLAYYLCSKQASFITGTDVPIDGGFTRLNN